MLWPRQATLGVLAHPPRQESRLVRIVVVVDGVSGRQSNPIQFEDVGAGRLVRCQPRLCFITQSAPGDVFCPQPEHFPEE